MMVVLWFGEWEIPVSTYQMGKVYGIGCLVEQQNGGIWSRWHGDYLYLG